jgi:hypothetical protein
MIKIDDIIRIDNEEFFVITNMNYNNIDYFFVNQIDEKDESLNVYKIVFEENNKINVLTDNDLINLLLPQFEEKINKLLKELGDNNE